MPMNDFDSNFLNAERHIQDDGTKLVSSSSGTSSDDYDGHASGTSISISEIAGQRLYQNALETQKMIEEKIKERSKIPTPTLNLATRRRSSRESSPISGIAPRYIQLYESAKAKSYEDAEERALANAQYEVRDFSPSRNLGCERLYSLSSGKQQGEIVLCGCNCSSENSTLENKYTVELIQAFIADFPHTHYFELLSHRKEL